MTTARETKRDHRLTVETTYGKELFANAYMYSMHKYTISLDESSNGSLEQRLGINFSVLVLTAGSWPFHQANLPTLTIPQELIKSVQVFRDSDIAHWFEFLLVARYRLVLAK